MRNNPKVKVAVTDASVYYAAMAGITLLLAGLNVFGGASIPWAVVLAPLWLPAVILIGLAFTAFVCVGVYALGAAVYAEAASKRAARRKAAHIR